MLFASWGSLLIYIEGGHTVKSNLEKTFYFSHLTTFWLSLGKHS